MQTKEIKAKINSVSNIKKITGTMEMVSVAKMKKATMQSLQSATYSKYAKEILETIISEPEIKISSPYLDLNETTNTELIVIIAANKGLCGGYNTNINRLVSSYIKKQNSTTNFKTITIGKNAERIARRNGLSVTASFTSFRDYFSIDDALSIRKVIIDEYQKGDIRAVKMFFTNFIKALTYEPKIEQILPLNKESLNIVEKNLQEKTEKNPYSVYLFEPDLNQIINNIVPGIVTTIIFQGLLDSSASEHSSRMVAMKNATDNATNFLEDLKLSYNKARQEGITKEISEIAAGSEASN